MDNIAKLLSQFVELPDEQQNGLNGEPVISLYAVKPVEEA